MEIGADVVDVLRKVTPLVRRVDRTHASMALALLSARYASDAGASEEEFIEACRFAWTQRESR